MLLFLFQFYVSHNFQFIFYSDFISVITKEMQSWSNTDLILNPYSPVYVQYPW